VLKHQQHGSKFSGLVFGHSSQHAVDILGNPDLGPREAQRIFFGEKSVGESYQNCELSTLQIDEVGGRSRERITPAVTPEQEPSCCSGAAGSKNESALDQLPATQARPCCRAF
jgi:hypothetical protein